MVFAGAYLCAVVYDVKQWVYLSICEAGFLSAVIYVAVF